MFNEQSEEDKAETRRNQALYHVLGSLQGTKLTVDELIIEARKIEEFLKNG